VDDLKARAASADQERRERLNQRLRQAFIEEPRRTRGDGAVAG
jgi:hypothetical protein